MLVRQYRIRAFPFPDIVGKYFPVNLDKLHTLYPDVGETDQDTTLHQMVYGALDESFYYNYKGFIQHVLETLEKRDWSVQAIPTFRFQLPYGQGTKEFHRDRDYNHPVQALNVVVPLTRMFSTTAIFFEAVPYSDVYAPLRVNPGEYILFDGANVKHGTKSNVEGYTRVSFDFRLVPTEFVPKQGTTVTHKVQLKDYYRKV